MMSIQACNSYHTLDNEVKFHVNWFYKSTNLKSVLDPLLFITYINDDAYQISSSSNINLCVDDIAPQRVIYSTADYTALRDDINAVSSCLSSKHLNLNASKHCFMLLSWKRTNSIPPPPLTIKDTPLPMARYRYSGVLILYDLMWLSHVINVCNKTRRLIGLFYYNIPL